MKNKCWACGLCCRLFLINLNEKEYKSGKYKTVFEKYGIIEDFKKAARYGANIIAQKEDGSCFYLKGELCSIHKTRPVVCRKFFCTSKNKDYKEMNRILKEAIDKRGSALV